jgi:glycine cleavage system T protein
MAEKTPLYDEAANRGAVFTEEAGWLMPADYGQSSTEYQQARGRAALFDLSHQGKVEVAGPESAKFLHNLCTNDIVHLAVGSGCEAFFPTGQAKIVGYALVYHVAAANGVDSFWLDPGPGMGEKLARHLDRYLISEQVEISDRSRTFAQLHVAGPEASAIVQKSLQVELSNLSELQHKSVTPQEGGVLQIRRHDVLAVTGYDIACPTSQSNTVWRVLILAGAKPAGLKAYETLRVEAGTPVYGRDIDETNLPQEVGRSERAISFTKGCYIGQETVARIRTYGHVNRSLVGLKLAAGPVSAGTKVRRDGKEIGHVTSSVMSPLLGGAIALAYVRRGSEEPGTALEVDAETGTQSAEVAALPFGGVSGGK